MTVQFLRYRLQGTEQDKWHDSSREGRPSGERHFGGGEGGGHSEGV